jgi:hypothetical protein
MRSRSNSRKPPQVTTASLRSNMGTTRSHAATCCYTVGMDDAAGSSTLKHAGDRARHTLTVKEVWQQLFDAGVPRSERRIKYFCQNGTLDAGYLPSPTGDQWYVNPASMPGLIGELKQFDEQRRARGQQAAAGSSILEKEPATDSDAAGLSRLQQAASELKNRDDGGVSQHAAPSYVTQLEKRIEEKDQQIQFLQEELKDRRAQISGMKQIIEGHRALLEQINAGFAPVFRSLAQAVAPKRREPEGETVTATVVDEPAEAPATQSTVDN